MLPRLLRCCPLARELFPQHFLEVMLHAQVHPAAPQPLLDAPSVVPGGTLRIPSLAPLDWQLRAQVTLRRQPLVGAAPSSSSLVTPGAAAPWSRRVM